MREHTFLFGSGFSNINLYLSLKEVLFKCMEATAKQNKKKSANRTYKIEEYYSMQMLGHVC